MKIDVLDKGYVELMDMMGDDLSPVEAARVSFGKDAYKDEEKNKKLLEYLYEHEHTATLEHVVLKFRVKAPLFCFRQWMRHRIGSFNERSGRYTEFDDDEFYVPAEGRFPDLFNKQGSVYTDEDYNHNRFIAEVHAASVRSFETYKKFLEMDIAKELARIILPVNFYSEMIWTVNLRSLFNFLKLRMDSHAQYEIQEYARAIAEIVKLKLPNNYFMFEKYIVK